MMRKLADIVVVIAAISVLAGVITRFSMKHTWAVSSGTYLEVAGVVILFAIALQLRSK